MSKARFVWEIRITLEILIEDFEAGSIRKKLSPTDTASCAEMFTLSLFFYLHHRTEIQEYCAA